MSTNAALIQSLREALEHSPDAVPLRKHLADLLLADGSAAEAVAEYRRALDLAPGDIDIKLALAEAYTRQEKPDVALVILEEILREPAPPEAAVRAYQALLADNPTFKKEASLPTGPAKAAPTEPPVPDKKSLVFVTPTETEEEEEMVTAGMVERPRITFADVGGMEALKEEIRMKIIYPVAHPELYKVYGKRAGGGILMYGPPGCGKTFLARATAGEVKANFVAVGLHDVLDMYLGQSEQNLHEVFALARSHTPCVLFFDEVDALGASRSDMRHSGIRQVINQFLSELDGVDSSNEGVLILAATNVPWHLDQALRRPGRFDRVLFVPPPDGEARTAILRLMLADKPTEMIDYGRLARQTEGFSGADLRGIVDQAVEHKLREAMARGVPAPLATQDLLTALKAAHSTTQEWFTTARNYALYANQGGLYDDILEYLKHNRR